MGFYISISYCVFYYNFEEHFSKTIIALLAANFTAKRAQNWFENLMVLRYHWPSNLAITCYRQSKSFSKLLILNKIWRVWTYIQVSIISVLRIRIHMFSGLPDQDPLVRRNGSGSSSGPFYHQAKIVRINLIPNVGILNVTEETNSIWSRIRIRIWIR